MTETDFESYRATLNKLVHSTSEHDFAGADFMIARTAIWEMRRKVSDDSVLTTELEKILQQLSEFYFTNYSNADSQLAKHRGEMYVMPRIGNAAK
jgi:hypothetical protein